MTTAGHIAAHRAERANQLAGGEAGDGLLTPGGGQLRNREGANLLGGCGERRAQRGRDGLPRSSHLLRRDAQASRVLESVELGRITQQGAVALTADILDDAPDGGQHGVESRAAAHFKRSQRFLGLPRATAFGSDDFHARSPII